MLILACLSTSRKGDRIYHQLKKLGSSLDWNRACFTMDPVSRRVSGLGRSGRLPKWLPRRREYTCRGSPQEASPLRGHH